MSTPTVRVGLIGTSWWSQAMYLPALAHHPRGRITAICGRDPDRTASVAAEWNVERSYTDWEQMIDDRDIDALIVASPNETHYDITMAALGAHLPVLCEKPIGMNASQAQQMADAAARVGVTTMAPFTYRFMPTNRFVKRLIDDGFVGQPYQLSMRYFAGYARDGAYAWRFDEAAAGSGILGDLGSHWIDMARWMLGEITTISAQRDHFVPRQGRPDATDYVPLEDSAVILARFESGASAVLQVSAVCWEGTPFGQIHELDLHGSGGTIHAMNDWDTVQEVRGLRAGERGPAQVVTIPDDIWNGAPHSPVHDTYRYVFRRTEAMTRGWVTAIAEGRSVSPDLAEAARVQTLVDAAIDSATSNGAARDVRVSAQ